MADLSNVNPALRGYIQELKLQISVTSERAADAAAIAADTASKLQVAMLHIDELEKAAGKAVNASGHPNSVSVGEEKEKLTRPDRFY